MTPEQEIVLLNHIDRTTLLLQKLSTIVMNLEKEQEKLFKEVYK